nr:hypothetical protein CFP56_13543 [Quercus suber]
MTKEVGAHIANEVGELIIVDAPKNGIAWGLFLRIRVNIDITKPLMGGKIIQIKGLEADKAIDLPGPLIRSNSSVVTQDQVIKMSSYNVDIDGIGAITDLNFKQRDKDKFCKELEPEVEAYPDKVLLLNSKFNSISSKVIKESAEQQFESWEDMEMELSSNKVVEKIDLEKSTLRTWKRVIRNKKISNSGNVAHPNLLSSKRLAITRDPNTRTDLHPHHKKQAIELSTVSSPLSISRGGSLPPPHTP